MELLGESEKEKRQVWGWQLSVPGWNKEGQIKISKWPHQPLSRVGEFNETDKFQRIAEILLLAQGTGIDRWKAENLILRHRKRCGRAEESDLLEGVLPSHREPVFVGDGNASKYSIKNMRQTPQYWYIPLSFRHLLLWVSAKFLNTGNHIQFCVKNEGNWGTEPLSCRLCTQGPGSCRTRALVAVCLLVSKQLVPLPTGHVPGEAFIT